MYVWIKHSDAEVHTNTRMGEKDRGALVLDTARAMSVSAQLCLRNVEGGFTINGVDIGALPQGVTGTYRHVENVVYNDGVPYPDKLSLATTVDVKNNVTHIIRLFFDVSADAVAGISRVPVVVKTTLGDMTVTVTLHVYPVTLPNPDADKTFGHEYFLDPFSYFPIGKRLENPPVTPFYDCERYSPRWWALMENYAKTLKTLRVNCLHISIMALLVDSGSKRLPDGSWQLNFDLMDQFVSHFFTHGAFRFIAISAIIASVDGNTIRYIDEQGHMGWANIGEPLAEAWAEAFYGGLYAHAKAKGWLPMLVMRLQDEPHTKKYWLWARNKCRTYMPGVPCGEPIDTHTVGRELAGACDQFIPRLEVYDEGADFYTARQKMGDTVWCYSCCLPEEPWWLNKFIDLPHRYSRLIKWACFSQGITGFLHWGFAHWGIARYGLSPEARYKGDGFIVYPDVENNGLSLSIRGFATLEGIQDYELLRLLSAYDPHAARALSRRVARTFRDFDLDEDAADNARRELLALLSSYVNE